MRSVSHGQCGRAGKDTAGQGRRIDIDRTDDEVFVVDPDVERRRRGEGRRVEHVHDGLRGIHSTHAGCCQDLEDGRVRQVGRCGRVVDTTDDIQSRADTCRDKHLFAIDANDEVAGRQTGRIIDHEGCLSRGNRVPQAGDIREVIEETQRERTALRCQCFELDGLIDRSQSRSIRRDRISRERNGGTGPVERQRE